MGNDSGSPNHDPTPGDFLSAEDDVQAEIILSGLFERIVIPQIKSTLSSYLTLTIEERDEIKSDAQVRTLAKLRSMRDSRVRGDDGAVAFNHFAAYVSTITVNCRKDYILRKQPEWRRVGNRLRRFAEERDCPLLFFRDDEGTQFVGLKNNPNKRSNVASEKLIERIRKTIPNHLFWSIQDAVPKIVEMAGGALPRNELMKIFLESTESAVVEEVEFPEELAEIAYLRSSDDIITKRQRSTLDKVWNEIRGFPANQRKVLLLSLRESRETEAVTLLLQKRIATIAEIAETLEVGLEEFSSIFDRLPMSSSEIADFLAIEDGERTSREQKVDNLRRIARDLLRRRLGIRK